jgi:hypothetical protein
LGSSGDRDVLRRFFSYRAKQLQGLVDAVRAVIAHNLTKGIEAERALADLLGSLLPPRFTAGKGFVIDSKGYQSGEIDLIVLDSPNTARLYDFRVFELIPVEAALACIEVKTTLTKAELDATFAKFQKVQEMEFFQERIMLPRNHPGEVGLSARSTTRPELLLFAYESNASDDAIGEVYSRHPSLLGVKTCVLQKGIVGELPPDGLGWLEPEERDAGRVAGQVLALFLFQLFLPALFAQVKGQTYYVKYLEGQSTFTPLS